MFISITYAGVDKHIEGIREELRSMERLRDQLRSLCRQAEESMMDPAPLRRCVNELGRIEESMRKRKEFLGILIADMQRVNADVGEILDRMERGSIWRTRF